jgi:hypothetical protein
MKTLLGGLGKNGISVKKLLLLFIILIVIIIGLSLLRNNLKFKTKKSKLLLNDLHDCKKEKKVSAGDIPKSGEANEYNYNFWLFISDYKYKQDFDKLVFYRGKNTVNSNPCVWLLKDNSILKLSFALQSNNSDIMDESCGLTDCSLHDSFLIENVPIQKWVNINISVSDNIVDVYFNGSLEKSYELKGYPISDSGGIRLTDDGGFNGFISKLEYSNYAISNDDIFKKYNAGHKN